MGKKERVILIKGDASKWYDQAIFIVNQDTPQDKIPEDFVAEAEKIIYNHIQKGYKQVSANVGIAYATSPKQSVPIPTTPKRYKKVHVKNKRFNFTLNTLTAIGCFLLAAVLMWGFLS